MVKSNTSFNIIKFTMYVFSKFYIKYIIPIFILLIPLCPGLRPLYIVSCDQGFLNVMWISLSHVLRTADHNHKKS
jgi:hypothetical protein